jgi:hypothetical protein
VAVVEPGGTEPFEEQVAAVEVNGEPASDGGVPEGGGEEGFADSDRDGDRLQQLRAVLPCEVRVTAVTHPLFGRLLAAKGFKRLRGVLYLVVMLPDGTPGTVRADATDVAESADAEQIPGTVLSVDGIRRLRSLVLAQPRRVRGGAGRTAS